MSIRIVRIKSAPINYPAVTVKRASARNWLDCQIAQTNANAIVCVLRSRIEESHLRESLRIHELKSLHPWTVGSSPGRSEILGEDMPSHEI